MTRWTLLAGIALAQATWAGEDFVPAPADQVPLYSAAVLPCSINGVGPRLDVRCKGPDGKDLLRGKSLRELAIMRNTIFARYGWDGYRKEWLRNYFHTQPWFKPNPKFTYKLLTETDKKNVHFIATKENSFGSADLARMQNEVYARHGKGHDDALLTADERIELGLLSRALGGFAVDGEKLDEASASLDRILPVEQLRKMSLRDLRYLRNTLYARHGRAFKSQVLQDHFEQMDWYKVDPAYSDEKLTANDKRNIQLIRSVEDEFGGPLRDEDWLIDPATDGA